MPNITMVSPTIHQKYESWQTSRDLNTAFLMMGSNAQSCNIQPKQLPQKGRGGGYFAPWTAVIAHRYPAKILIPVETAQAHVFIYLYRTTETKEAWKNI